MNPADDHNAELNRRDFLKGGSMATLMAMMGGVPLIAQAEPEKKADAEPAEPKVKVKVAVIGLNTWGREILDQLGRLEEAEVVVICDHYPAMLKRSATKAPHARPVEDYQAVLADKNVEAVVIATATHQHKEIVIAALKAGKHVYCEAPLAHTVDDAKAIALAAKDAVGKVFQAGLQFRSDPQRHFLLPFVRSGALGKPVKARAQWHKKTSWRQASPNSEREQALNWRLDKTLSPGLAGEIGIHALDQAGWLFNLQPQAVTGFGSTTLWKDDGRAVADTVDAVIEFAGGVRMSYHATIATSFYDADYELLHGSDATIMMRENKAWMFKEVDSPLLGWEVYARKDSFFKDSGIVLAAGGSKQTALAETPVPEAAAPPPLYYALQNFLGNCVEMTSDVENFTATFGDSHKEALAENLAGIKYRPAANWKDGYAATVLALKVNEAITTGKRIALKPEWFDPA